MTTSKKGREDSNYGEHGEKNREMWQRKTCPQVFSIPSDPNSFSSEGGG
jgi:hypothetical protein